MFTLSTTVVHTRHLDQDQFAFGKQMFWMCYVFVKCGLVLHWKTEKGRKRKDEPHACIVQYSALSLNWQGSDKWAFTLALLISLYHVVTHMHCTALHRRCTNWTNTHTLWAMPVVAAHAKRLVPTNVHCRYLTCTELQLHGPVTPRNTHSELQSTLIISYLLPVPSSLLLQWRQCACDKRVEGSFNSCSLFLGFWNGERHKKGI